MPPPSSTFARSWVDPAPPEPIELRSTCAVEQITAHTRVLVDSLVTKAPAKNREVEAAKARARAAPPPGRFAMNQWSVVDGEW